MSRRSVIQGREAESTTGMLGLGVSNNFSFRCLDFETESLLHFLKEHLSLSSSTRSHSGQRQHGLENAAAARSRGSEVYSESLSAAAYENSTILPWNPEKVAHRHTSPGILH